MCVGTLRIVEPCRRFSGTQLTSAFGLVDRISDRSRLMRKAVQFSDYAIADPTDMTPIVGRVVERGLSDEYNDRHYLIIEGMDGRSHYVDIGKGDATDFSPTGAVVRLAPKPTEARAVDRTVAEIAIKPRYEAIAIRQSRPLSGLRQSGHKAGGLPFRSEKVFKRTLVDIEHRAIGG